MQIIVCSDRKIKYFFSYNQYYGQKNRHRTPGLSGD